MRPRRAPSRREAIDSRARPFQARRPAGTVMDLSGQLSARGVDFVPARLARGCDDPGCAEHLAEPFDHSARGDRKSTRLNSSHLVISYAVFCLNKKNM